MVQINFLERHMISIEAPYTLDRVTASVQLLSWSDAANGGILQEKVFLEISQNSQEDTCARVSILIKWQAWDL